MPLLNTVHTDQGVWDYDYDSEDRLTMVTDPFGNTREREYDDDGNVSEVRLNGDIVSTYTYDEDGNLIQRTDAMGEPYTFDYNDDNQLIRQEDPAGAFTEYEYDEGRLWKTRDGNGNEIVREYELVETSGFCPSCGYSPLEGGQGGVERLTRIIYPTFTKEFVYDDDGRVSEEIYHLSETESYSVTFAYDAFGRLKSATGPDNETTTYEFDVLGRRTSVTDPSGTTQFEFDLWDNLIALTDAENQRTEFEYYADGKLWKERRPMGEETTYEYDALGRLGKVTDAKSQTTEYGYNAQSRIETIAYADGKTVTLSYDADGNLAGYSDGTTSATYTYDDMGRKLTEMVNYGSFSKSFSYSYYGNGLKQTFTAPDSTVYTYLYGLNNELQDVQIPGVGSITIPNYAWNRPATVNYPGGTQRSYTYDALMRLQSLTVLDPGSTPLLDYAYTHDEVGNILTKTTEHGNYTYGYDNVSRLTSADNPVLADESYTYDDVGNRLTSTDVSGNWSYNTNNELLGYADVEYEYDDNGNMTQITVAGSVVWACVYDAANRLVHVEDGTGTISADYYYDPFGRRLWKDVGGTKTYFFYSEEGLIAEYDTSGVEIRSYGYQPDSTWTTDPLFLKEGGAYYWYQNDHLGTPQKLVAQDGTVVWSVQYRSFGEANVQVETIENHLRLPGQYEDPETGLHYNYFRYYDPKIGRYLRTDPIGFVGGDLNLYAYVYNNPIAILDPLALKCCVRLIVHTAHRKLSDQNTFDNVAKSLEDEYRALKEKDVDVLPRKFAETGKEIVEFINEQEDDSILSLDIFSHANLGGIHISRNIKPQLSPDYKRQLHDWIRDDQDASDAEFMEESYHGLYTDPRAAWGVSVYFNQVAGPGIAYLPEIDFAKFTADAKIEFHGCKTAMEIEEKDIEAIKAYVDTRPWLQLIIRGLRIDPASIQVTNFARRFSEKLGAAGKTEAKVTGHVGKSGPPEKGPGGNSYQYGHRRVYQNGELIEELY